MARRSTNWRRIKLHRSYTVAEIVRVLDVHENTVRGWIKHGLPTVDGPGLTLVRGEVLIELLRSRKVNRPCGPGRIYCVACRSPQEPADGFAAYEPLKDGQGNLVGICPTCDRVIYRRVSVRKIDEAAGTLEVQFPEAARRLGESD